MKICTIIGARPQFIKAAPISRAIAAHNRLAPHPSPLTEVIIHTGQHYDYGMSEVFFQQLNIPEPAHNLGIGSASHGRQTGQMLTHIEEVLSSEKPDWVLVYGDTNSTLAGALAAAKLHVPIAHVEAGLRSFNRRMPEEINRVLTDHLSSLLFCPGKTAISNLKAEGITHGIHDVGDVMMDALQFALSSPLSNNGILSKHGLKQQSYLLATVHRAENTDDTDRLKNILVALSSLNDPVVFPIHPRTRKILATLNYSVPPHLLLIDPVGFFEMIALEKWAKMILTDSGGIQKEAYWLKVPCVTLRDETEWVETVDTGWNTVTGTDAGRIIDAVRSFMPPASHPPLFGDGNAALKIIQTLSQI